MLKVPRGLMSKPRMDHRFPGFTAVFSPCSDYVPRQLLRRRCADDKTRSRFWWSLPLAPLLFSLALRSHLPSPLGESRMDPPSPTLPGTGAFLLVIKSHKAPPRTVFATRYERS